MGDSEKDLTAAIDPAGRGPGSPWRRAVAALRNVWLTATVGTPERSYERRSLRRIAQGNLRDTLGLQVRDEAATRAQAEKWLAQLIESGVRPDQLCVEYGCGSLWCAEPVIRHLQPGRFIGLDVTDRFYEFGRQRLGDLLREKQVRLAVISRQSLREVAAGKPDIVFSHRVLHHVPRRGLARYMRNLCALLSDHTVLLIEHRARPKELGAEKVQRYTVADLRPYLPRGWDCQPQPFGFRIARIG